MHENNLFIHGIYVKFICIFITINILSRFYLASRCWRHYKFTLSSVFLIKFSWSSGVYCEVVICPIYLAANCVFLRGRKKSKAPRQRSNNSSTTCTDKLIFYCDPVSRCPLGFRTVSLCLLLFQFFVRLGKVFLVLTNK